MLVFSYSMNLNVIIVGNYAHEFSVISNQEILIHQLKLNVNISMNGNIYILYHIHMKPLQKMQDGNHFAYLDPIPVPNIPIEVNTIKSIDNGKRKQWTNKENNELYKCFILAKKQGITNCKGVYEIWRGRNPTIRPYMTPVKLQRRRNYLDGTLTESEKKCITEQCTKECLRSVSTTNVNIPQLCKTINRRIPLDRSLEELTKTKVSDSKHKACVCSICDCFIIGVEEIKWLNEEQLKAKESYLSVQFLESMAGRPMPVGLRNQYKIEGNNALSNLLLSPRAHVRDGKYMSCNTCFRHIVYSKSENPPKYAIRNNWCIGQIPDTLIEGGIDDILAASVARIRLFSNVYSYTAGAHKAIKGHHVFFVNDPKRIGESFEYIVKSGAAPEMYVMLCGRATPTQRDIIRRRCSVNTENYKTLLNWLIHNHPSYQGMDNLECCSQPILLSGFEETTNNTDEPKEEQVENVVEGEQMSFAPENEPSENTGPYQSEKELIFSYLGGKKPTLLLRNGDYIGSHKIKLIEIFPLAFPYGWGGPDEKRATKISKAAILRHYCHIALPQMHESQFLLVLCSMWQRMESFTKCIINCKSSFKSSTLAEKLSEVTLQEVETAAKYVLNGEETTNETLKKLFTSIKGHTSSIGHSNKAASYARHKLFLL